MKAAYNAISYISHYPPSDFEPAISDLALFLWEEPEAVITYKPLMTLGNGASELIDLVIRQVWRIACSWIVTYGICKDYCNTIDDVMWVYFRPSLESGVQDPNGHNTRSMLGKCSCELAVWFTLPIASTST